MDGLFDFLNVDFLHDLLPNSWFESAHNHFGGGLTDEMIAQSIQEASDFFNMNAPMDVHEDWTTGVMTGMTFTENDDILIFNRQQMLDMGITDKEGFDLVMTHEGAHRALQGLNTGFTDHQEELCCDYLAGVRAGLNNMAEGKMSASLIGTMESDSHPDGTVRVEAIEEGVKFAHDYLKEHNGDPPTFSECLDHFHDTSVYTDTLPHQEPGHITLRPEHAFANTDNLHPQLQREMKGFTQADVDWYEHQARISSGSEQAHWLEEAKWARNHIHSYAADDVAPSGDLSEMEVKGFTQADVDWYEHQARISSGSEQAHWLKEAQWARNHIHSYADTDATEVPGQGGQDVREFHRGQYGNATGDYWDDSHPVDGEHGKLHGLFVDNREYHLHEAQTAKENAEWHRKRASEAIARGDISSAKDHESRAASYDRAQRDHLSTASKCTKFVDDAVKGFSDQSGSSPFSSGFDAEHPMPTYEELRNAGFSDHIANRILSGDSHSYSQRELYQCLYESDDPLAAYNEMMHAKVEKSLAESDALINRIESGL